MSGLQGTSGTDQCLKCKMHHLELKSDGKWRYKLLKFGQNG